MSRVRVLMAGGGSGGHVTPLIAIAQILQKEQKDIVLTLLTDRSFYSQTTALVAEKDIAVKKIFAGKYRRYHGKSFAWHLVHLPTLLGNIGDILLLALGTLQSIAYLAWHKPDVVFCKGGFVCVPVGLAARLWRIPMVIHDSDTHPGLTNRILARWARVIATGMPSRYYHYPKEKMQYTGIPVRDVFSIQHNSMKEELRREYNLSKDRPILLITGGGTGAKSLNEACSQIADKLIEQGWEIVHFTGKGKGSDVQRARNQLDEGLQRYWHIFEFAEIVPYVQVADIIVSRAGATAMQEFANAKKPVILMPNPQLTGGHQTKNAAMFVEHGAAYAISQDHLTDDPKLLITMLGDLRDQPKKQTALASALYETFAKPHAAKELSDIILAQIEGKRQ